MTHSDMGYSESTFSKYAFGRGGGGHKKEYAVYARENDDNYGRPLSTMNIERMSMVLYWKSHTCVLLRLYENNYNLRIFKALLMVCLTCSRSVIELYI